MFTAAHPHHLHQLCTTAVHIGVVVDEPYFFDDFSKSQFSRSNHHILFGGLNFKSVWFDHFPNLFCFGKPMLQKTRND